MMRRLVLQVGIIIPGICIFLGFQAFASTINPVYNSTTNKSIDSVVDFNVISDSLNQLASSENDPGTLIKTAFSIRNNHSFFDDSVSEDASNFLLQKAANLIERFRYSSNLFKAIAYRQMANDLQKKGIPIDIPLSNFRKVVINLQQKNYQYLFSRIQLQVKYVISDSITNHKTIFAGSAFLLLAFIGVQAKKKRFLNAWLIVILVFGIGLLYWTAPKSQSVPKYLFQAATFDFVIKNEIGACRILNERNIQVGKLIWADEKAVGLSYNFSPFKIAPIFDSIANHNQLLINTTASFVNNLDQPVGYTAIAGKILNPMIHYQWDGLVLVTYSKLDIVYLKKAKNGNPITSFESYYKLTKHIKDSHSDAFQVPLLVYNDSLLLNPENASAKLHESRIFLRVVSPENKAFCMIAEMENFYPLAYNTLAIFNELKAKKYSVKFMALLDVGANNLFQVYNSDGIINGHYFSTLSSEKAINALSVFLLEKSKYSIEPLN
jgi:hypothetical protein